MHMTIKLETENFSHFLNNQFQLAQWYENFFYNQTLINFFPQLCPGLVMIVPWIAMGVKVIYSQGVQKNMEQFETVWAYVVTVTVI